MQYFKMMKNGRYIYDIDETSYVIFDSDQTIFNLCLGSVKLIIYSIEIYTFDRFRLKSIA